MLIFHIPHELAEFVMFVQEFYNGMHNLFLHNANKTNFVITTSLSGPNDFAAKNVIFLFVSNADFV